MTGLLVSVRSAEEAELALAGGADVIDVKEPRRGALGPADPSVWRQILHVVGGRAVVSAALGELHSDEMGDYAVRAAGFAYAKIGLSNWRRNQNSTSKWLSTLAALPVAVCAVPVVYADMEATGWPDLRAALGATIALAAESKSPLLVIDTFRKDQGNLLEQAPIALLEEMSCVAANQNVRFVFAGSLNEWAVEKLLPLEPMYIGVRGAACRGGRDGTIDLARVKSLARLIGGRPQKAVF